MSNLPRTLRQKLGEHYTLNVLQPVRTQGSPDTTQKFLWKLKDESMIESVLIPANPAPSGELSDRHTLCVSTQVGCAYGCRFCASGLEGWKRNLGPEEIVEQVLAVERENQPNAECGVRSADFGGTAPLQPNVSASRLISNLVIMGMGEPLANYDNLLRALKILNAP